jgi:hypothetical protein
MLTGRRVVVLASGATLLAMLAGGGAWADSRATAPSQHAHVKTAFEATTSAGATSTTFGDTSTTSLDDTTTTVEVGTTRPLPETTSTAVSTTTAPATTTTGPLSCKPGWGYGDTNHCHSGPPGLHKTNNSKTVRGRHSG